MTYAEKQSRPESVILKWCLSSVGSERHLDKMRVVGSSPTDTTVQGAIAHSVRAILIEPKFGLVA